jgi:uncharacterized protein (DUF433 family)
VNDFAICDPPVLTDQTIVHVQQAAFEDRSLPATRTDTHSKPDENVCLSLGFHPFHTGLYCIQALGCGKMDCQNVLLPRRIPMAEISTKTEYSHIVCTPGVVAGEPRIDGHRVRVRDIVAARDLGGLTPEEIAASVYPGLTLAQVYSALAYYEDHRNEIDQAMQQEAQFVEQFLNDHPQLARDVRPAKS